MFFFYIVAQGNQFIISMILQIHGYANILRLHHVLLSPGRLRESQKTWNLEVDFRDLKYSFRKNEKSSNQNYHTSH